jgi:predicted nucleic acid-binding protein
MTSAIFLDTSGVIALLHRGDAHHDKANQLARILVGQNRPRVTTTAVLAELGDGFSRKGRWDVIAPFLTAVLDDPRVSVLAVDTDLIQSAIQFRNSRLDKDWGLTDCLTFVVMSDLGIQEAFTADRHFQQAGFRALLLEEGSA